MSPSRIDTIFTALFGIVAVVSWVGLTLAESHLFRGSVLVAALALTAVVLWILRPRAREARTTSDAAPRGGGWLVVWLALAVVLFAKPGEYLIDGGDGSVYLNIGRALARHGGLTFSEPTLDLVAPQDWPALFTRDRGPVPVYDLFPGGLQVAADRNLVLPGFFPLLPIWIATLEILGGPRAAYYVSSGFAALSVAGIWLLGRRLSSLTSANVAAGLLTVNFSQVWFARTQTSEILTQAMVIAGLYFTVVAARESSRAAGVLAGAAFGLAACARIDALVLISPFVAGYLIVVWLQRQWSPVWTVMAATFGLLTIQTGLHAWFVASAYTRRVLGFAVGLMSSGDVALALLAAAVLIGLAAWTAAGRRRSPIAPRWLAPAGAVALVLVAVMRLGLHAGGGYLTMLLTPIGLVAAVAGAAWLLIDRVPTSGLLVIAVFFASAMVYGESVRDQTTMPTLFRRFVPVVVPLALLFVGHAVTRLATLAGRWRVGVLVLPMFLAVAFARDSRPLLAATPMRGLHDRFAAASSVIPQNALVIADASTPSHFGLSLRYSFDRRVVFVHPGAGADVAIRRLVVAAAAKDQPVILALGRDAVHADALTREHVATLRLAAAGTIALDHLAIEPTDDRLPRVLRAAAPVVELYRMAQEGPVTVPFEVDIGDHDFGWRIAGFHGREQMGTSAARWTHGRADIAVPQVAPAGNGLALALRVAAPRPTGLAPVTLRVELDGDLVSVAPALGPEFGTYRVPLADWAVLRLTSAPSRLTLSVSAFVPADHGGSRDTRTLGVAVDWIRIEERAR